MGCLWSMNDEERCADCNRRAVNNLVVVNNICEICDYRKSRERDRRPTVTRGEDSKPRFGEYRCACGHFWNSRYARAQVYQACKLCLRHVYPRNVRDLRASDMSGGRENHEEHKQELCQMCQQLGHHCARGQGRARSAHNTRSRQITKSKSQDIYKFSL